MAFINCISELDKAVKNYFYEVFRVLEPRSFTTPNQVFFTPDNYYLASVDYYNKMEKTNTTVFPFVTLFKVSDTQELGNFSMRPNLPSFTIDVGKDESKLKNIKALPITHKIEFTIYSDTLNKIASIFELFLFHRNKINTLSFKSENFNDNDLLTASMVFDGSPKYSPFPSAIRRKGGVEGIVYSMKFTYNIYGIIYSIPTVDAKLIEQVIVNLTTIDKDLNKFEETFNTKINR